ncbi:ion transporter [Segetibacter sp. 3557_3]|uniref:ion transporter n=1 Tax=Segetibacter sp. 3557_3 TaxID=2547429 RepID=UPI0010584E95|nr:ion transporter [Segetibacter sp. 3557_3]TDH28621.1 ion transporter [Segetibacter sp. 3557_3]
MRNQLMNERRRLLTSIDKWLEAPMIFLGFAWLILLVIELVWGLSKPLEYLSLLIWVVFIIDFLVKLILSPDKSAYFKKNWLTAISLLIPALRVVRIFRFVRLLRGLRGIRLVRIVSSLNRSMNSLGRTMQRRAFGYVLTITLFVTFAGAAGMYALERTTPGFDSYGMALWWTAMRVITAGNEFNPATPEGRGLALLIAIFGYTIFGYVTATFATFFIGRDAEEKSAPVAGSKDVSELKAEIIKLTTSIEELKREVRNNPH